MAHARDGRSHLGRKAEARDAFERASRLTGDSALRSYLLENAAQ